MAEEKNDTTQAPPTAGPASRLNIAPETGTPTTPGGGPTPTAPTHRVSEPGPGPAGDITAAVAAREKHGTATEEEGSAPPPSQGTSTSGHVVGSERAFIDEPVAHRQEAEQGERAAKAGSEE